MGIETEYAIASNAQDARIKDNPIELSFALVRAAADAADAAAATRIAGSAGAAHAPGVSTGASATGAHPPIRWDYRPEDPVNDARGYRLPRASARPEMLTDVPELRPTNVVAPNGGRIYVDHAHPEYSSPETMTPQAALAADRAGDQFMQESADGASATLGRTVSIYRNNTDGKGSSWGSHESYEVARAVPFDVLTRLMTLHFVSRQIYTGAGRVGVGEVSEKAGFQLSQRADYFHARVGLQTTFDRPIVNTRDESHSVESRRRLHVIIGDANRMDVPEVLKLGTTSLLAWVAENADAAGFDLEGLLARYELADPVKALHTVSHDLSLGEQLPLASGTGVRGDDVRGGDSGDADGDGNSNSLAATTAWQLQIALRGAVYAVGAAIYDTDSRGEPLWPDVETRTVLDLWGTVLAQLAQLRRENDDERLTDTSAVRNLEWLLKWQVLEGLRRRKNAGWDAPVLAAVDLSWANCDPAKSVFTKMASRASSLVSAADITAARKAPEDTRAWLRAYLIDAYPEAVAAASWKQIALRVPRVSGAAGGAPGGAGAGAMGGGAAGSARVVDGAESDIVTIDISDSAHFTREALESKLRRARTIAEVAAILGASIQ
jgi:proteasome accessory factor A